MQPLRFDNFGVEVVVPPFSALFSKPPPHELGNKGPSLRSVLGDQPDKDSVFLVIPRVFSHNFVSAEIALVLDFQFFIPMT